MASEETRVDLDKLSGDRGDVTPTDDSAPKEVWVKPEIVSYTPISATASATVNAGDALSSRS